MERFFKFQENGTTLTREVLAGCVTFVTMAYILCIQPALMSGAMIGTDTGMPAEALLVTTCIASAFACFLMGFYANYPLALAPGMGNNFFVVCELFPACALALGMNVGEAAVWQLAIGTVFIAGCLFLIISLLKVRNHLLVLMSRSSKMGICAGIGLFIAYLGLKNAGILVIENDQPSMGAFMTPDSAIFWSGLFVSAVLMIRKVPGAILIGMAVSTLAALGFGSMEIAGVFEIPADPMEVAGKMDLAGVWANLKHLVPFIFILLFMDVFDTFGSVIGVSHQAGFMKEDGTIPRMDRIFLADALGTMFGAFCGHSTVTTYVESASGVESGGRTGLTAVTVGVLFLVSIFFAPLILSIASCPPVTAPALVIVGVLMAGSLAHIDWQDKTEALPAFLILAGIPFFCSIASGILCGVIVYPFLKLLTGRVKETTPGMFILAAIMLVYALFLR